MVGAEKMKVETQINSIGGWCNTFKINCTDKTVFNYTCKICSKKYKATTKSNTRIEDIYIHEGVETISQTFWNGIVGNDIYRRAKLLIGICPNCGFEVHIGSVPSDEILKKEYRI